MEFALLSWAHMMRGMSLLLTSMVIADMELSIMDDREQYQETTHTRMAAQVTGGSTSKVGPTQASTTKLEQYKY